MDQNVVFKTAKVGGFEKRAVLDYIYKMNADMETERTDLKTQIEELTKQLEEVKNSAGSSSEAQQKVNNSLRTLERDLAKISNDLTEEKSKRFEAEKENDELRFRAKNLEEQISRLSAEKSTIADNEKYQELEAKREEIEKASYQVGRVMLDARADADNLIESATQQATKIKQQAQAEVNDLRAKTQTEVDEVLENTRLAAEREIANAKEERNRIISQTNIEIETRTNSTKEELARVIDRSKRHLADIVELSNTATNESEERLEALEHQATTVRSALVNTLENLNVNLEILCSGISSAKTQVQNQKDQLKDITVLDTANTHLEDLMNLMSGVKADIIRTGSTQETSVMSTVDIQPPQLEIKTEPDIAVASEPKEVYTEPFSLENEKLFEDTTFKSDIFEGISLEEKEVESSLEENIEDLVGQESTLLSNLDE